MPNKKQNEEKDREVIVIKLKLQNWQLSSLIVAFAWQIIFLLEATIFWRIIIIHPNPRMFYRLTYDYWTWFVTSYEKLPYESEIVLLCTVLGWFSFFSTGACILYYYFSSKSKMSKKQKRFSIGAGIWLLTSIFCWCLISKTVINYRLFMAWLPVEFLSVWLISLIVRCRSDG